jgi:hypothetical protein
MKTPQLFTQLLYIWLRNLKSVEGRKWIFSFKILILLLLQKLQLFIEFSLIFSSANSRFSERKKIIFMLKIFILLPNFLPLQLCCMWQLHLSFPPSYTPDHMPLQISVLSCWPWQIFFFLNYTYWYLWTFSILGVNFDTDQTFPMCLIWLLNVTYIQNISQNIKH